MKTVSTYALIVLAVAAIPSFAQKDARGLRRSSSSPSTAFEDLIGKADRAREAGLTDEALSLYQQAVRIKPDFAEGWWYLGTIYYDADRYSEGAAAFQHVTALKPKLALGWAMWGLCEFETKHYDSALVHLERGDQLGIPRKEDYYDVARYHLALLLTRSAHFDDAMRIVADFAAQGEQNPEFDEAMGLAALRKPLLPIELPSNEREMVLDVGRAMCDLSGRRQTDVNQDVSQLLAKYPATPQIHFLVGILELRNDSDKALEQWKEELKITPDNPQALESIAGEYVKRSEYKEARPYAEKAVAADPENFVAHAVLGQALSEGNLDVPRAIRELETAARLAPQNPQVRYALAIAYSKAGRKDEAARERAEFLRLRGQAPVAVPKSQ